MRLAMWTVYTGLLHQISEVRHFSLCHASQYIAKSSNLNLTIEPRI